MESGQEEYHCLQLALLVQQAGQKKSAYFIAKATEVSKVMWLARKQVQEVLNFIGRQTAIGLEDKPVHGQWDENVQCLVHGYKQGRLCIVAVTSRNYPLPTASRLMKQIINDVQARLPANWATVAKDCNLLDIGAELKMFTEIKRGNIELLQVELDQTKQLVMDNIQHIIQRQSNLDDILKDSEDLSAAAKEFVKDTKKLRRCRFCPAM